MTLASIVRPFAREGPWYWVRFALLMLLGWYAGHKLREGTLLTEWQYRVFQQEMRLHSPAELYPRRTALVLLDDGDYWETAFQGRTPLKRKTLADLLDRLGAAGVNIVALDVDLRSPHPGDPSFEFADYAAEDASLFASIAGFCASQHHLVLASSVRFASDGYHQMSSIYDAHLREMPCVVEGYIQTPFDMRRLPGALDLAEGGSLDSMSLALVGIADPAARDAAAHEDGEKGFRFSQYLSPQDFAPRKGERYIFSAADVQQMSPAELHRQLADRLVLVGANWHANAVGSGPLVDQHLSPGGSEPGVMLHANYVEAMLDRTGTFAPLSDSAGEAIEMGIAIGLAFLGLLEIHPAWKWGAFFAAWLFCLVLAYALLQSLGLFLDFLIPLLVVAGHKLGEEMLDVIREARAYRRIHANQHTVMREKEVVASGRPS